MAAASSGSYQFPLISLADGRMPKVGSETTQTGIRCWTARAALRRAAGQPPGKSAGGGCEMRSRHEYHRSTSTGNLDCVSTLAVSPPRIIGVVATHCPG